MQEEMKRERKDNFYINTNEFFFMKQFLKSLMNIKIHIELKCLTIVMQKSKRLKIDLKAFKVLAFGMVVKVITHIRHIK